MHRNIVQTISAGMGNRNSSLVPQKYVYRNIRIVNDKMEEEIESY